MTVLGPGLSLTGQVTLQLCLFVQMSLRATVTTTPTPATTPCLSAHLTPRPLTRSVLGVGLHCGCPVGTARSSGKLQPRTSLSLSHPSPARSQAVSSLPASRPPSGQVEPTGMITTTPHYLLTGSTAGSPLQGLWTGVGAWGPRPLVKGDVYSPASCFI